MQRRLQPPGAPQQLLIWSYAFEAGELRDPALSDGTLKGGQNIVYGLAEDAIDIAPFHTFDSMVPAEVKNAVAKAKQDIIAGKIKVPVSLAELGIKK